MRDEYNMRVRSGEGKDVIPQVGRAGGECGTSVGVISFL